MATKIVNGVVFMLLWELAVCKFTYANIDSG
jgi:hypothetical protein